MARLFFIAILLLTAGSIWGREGFVRTRHGAICEGHIRFEPEAVVVVDAAREYWQRIPLTNVLSVNLEAEPRHAIPVAFRDGGLPPAWSSVDVGAVTETGQAGVRSGELRLRSTGTNLFGGSDSFHFVFTPVLGDSHVVCRVLEIEDSHPLTQVGLTIRDGLRADAKQVSLVATARRGVFLGRRDSAGTDVETVAQRSMNQRQWLKLSRHGDDFVAQYSRDGRRWVLLARTHVVMPEEVMVGVAAVGFREGVMAGMRVDHVQEGQSFDNGFAPEVRLVGGSIEVEPLESMDDTFIRFSGEGTPVPTKAVANIRFRSVSQRMIKALAAGRTGVILTTGEFIAGDIRGVKNGFVTVSSVPLGLLHYDVSTEVAAVVLRKPGRIERASCRLTTASGSVWMAAAMSIEGDWVVLKDTFGVRRVPLYKIIEIEWHRNGVNSLDPVGALTVRTGG